MDEKTKEAIATFENDLRVGFVALQLKRAEEVIRHYAADANWARGTIGSGFQKLYEPRANGYDRARAYFEEKKLQDDGS